jgi:uncharacterized membrane protein
MVYLLALLIGAVAGLRAMTAPMIVSWAARLGWLPLDATPLAFLGHAWTPWILTALAVTELIYDKRPGVPSRTEPPGLISRIITGALSGGAIGAAGGVLVGGLAAGVAGAVAGTFGGRAFRGWLADLFKRDWPAALLEDVIAIGGALLTVAAR